MPQPHPVPPSPNDARHALLPAGLRDVLAPDAAAHADAVSRLMAEFAAHGYDRVDPPLVEFEDSLLQSEGADVARQTFRLMDPVSQRMMGVRTDMTIQIARIATTRLAQAARPLRLSYAGDVLRVRGSQLQPERQFTQVGAELIGASETEADIEIVRLAVSALRAAGVRHLSVDLNVAPLVAAVFEAEAVPTERRQRLRAALDRKDAGAITALTAAESPALAEILAGLMAATGPAQAALVLLTSIPLPPKAEALRADLARIAHGLRAADLGIDLTVDPVENRGFEYHSGVGFTVFDRVSRAELGRGGRYFAGTVGEPATGVSLYMDAVMAAMPNRSDRRRVFLPAPVDDIAAAALRADGWVTVRGLVPVADARGEARRLGCGYVFEAGHVTGLED